MIFPDIFTRSFPRIFTTGLEAHVSINKAPLHVV